jgi:hypothetical protein
MESALQLIMDQFKEVKSDLSDMIDDKLGKFMSTIANGLKTDMNGPRNEVSSLESMMNEANPTWKKGWRGSKRGDLYSGKTDTVLPGGHPEQKKRSRGPISSGGYSSRSCGDEGPLAKSTMIKPKKFDGATF